MTATKTSLSITIRPNAFWNWGGKKVPVTNKDLVYTWKQIVDPKNEAASTAGYDQIAGVTLKGTKTAVFKWKDAKPYADYRDLFGLVYPSRALGSLDWNTLWADCVCGTDGKPVSDGPFMLTNFTKGQGVTLKSNPFWYGAKPGLKEIDFKLLTDTNSEIQAMRGGEVDAIFPSPQTALSELVHQSGLTYNATPGFVLEHIDIQTGPQGQPLLKQPWMRQAIALAINRHSLIQAIFSSYSPGQKPLNNLIYFPADPAYRPDYAKWNFAPAKALVIGAGVAGLQAIATARRLGAVVEAFDTRPVVKEQVQSLGAKFLEIDLGESGAGAGGYAKELSEEAHRKEVELLAKAARENDIIITTAAIPGRKAPVLITKEMIPTMKPGSVIVDLAAETGGNVELTEAGKTVVTSGVTIIGLLNIPASMPFHASQMYSRNVASLLALMLRKDGTFDLNLGDEVVKGTVITHAGEVVHEGTKEAMQPAPAGARA